YTQVTRIEQISRLPIASRPVSRGAGQGVDFENLRAIPWVFAWTQTRYIVPGWYGIGQGLAAVLEADPAHLDALRRFNRDWPFFRAVLRNAQREMVRARFEIAAHYAGMAEAGVPDFHEVLLADFEKARAASLPTTEETELLAGTAVPRKPASLRHPYTDVLYLLPAELIRRFRQTPEEGREPLRQALFLSISGIAAGM